MAQVRKPFLHQNISVSWVMLDDFRFASSGNQKPIEETWGRTRFNIFENKSILTDFPYIPNKTSQKWRRQRRGAAGVKHLIRKWPTTMESNSDNEKVKTLDSNSAKRSEQLHQMNIIPPGTRDGFKPKIANSNNDLNKLQGLRNIMATLSISSSHLSRSAVKTDDKGWSTLGGWFLSMDISDSCRLKNSPILVLMFGKMMKSNGTSKLHGKFHYGGFERCVCQRSFERGL